MPVVPIEAQRVAPDRFDVRGARLFFKHWQRARRRLYWLPGFAIRLFSLVITQRARASVSQERKRIRGLMAILPRDDQAAAARDVHAHRLRIVAQIIRRNTDFCWSRRDARAHPLSIPHWIQWKRGIGSLLAAEPEPKPRPKIRPQRRVSDNFLVMVIESVLYVHVGGHARMELIPAAGIDAGVAGGVSDWDR